MTGIGYSQVANNQLDRIEATDPDLCADLVELCEDIFDAPHIARASASAITTADGIVMRSAVPGRWPYKIFWTLGGPRIEAVFPHGH